MGYKVKQDTGSTSPLANAIVSGFQAADLREQQAFEKAKYEKEQKDKAMQRVFEQRKAGLVPVIDKKTKEVIDYKPEEGGVLDLEKQNKKKGLIKSELDLDVKKSQVPFETLPPEKQAIVKGLGESVQKLSLYRNLIQAGFQKVMDSSQTQDQRLQSGRQLLKTLNSAAVANSDTAGQEEVRRLGPLLEYHILNFRDPGPVFGRAPIEEFGKQLQNKIGEIDETNRLNNEMIEQAYGRKTPGLVQSQTKSTNNSLTNQKNINAGSKPKQVIQNGHTYILNEATGQYE